MVCLPAVILRKFVFKHALSRKKGFLLSCLVGLFIVVISAIIYYFSNSMPKVTFTSVFVLVFIAFYIALVNTVILCKNTSNCTAEEYKKCADEYKDFFDEKAYNPELPKGSLKTLYNLASNEGCSTIDYIKKHMPQKVLKECEELRGRSNKLNPFLQLCFSKHVFCKTYIQILYNEYMKPTK